MVTLLSLWRFFYFSIYFQKISLACSFCELQSSSRSGKQLTRGLQSGLASMTLQFSWLSQDSDFIKAQMAFFYMNCLYWIYYFLSRSAALKLALLIFIMLIIPFDYILFKELYDFSYLTFGQDCLPCFGQLTLCYGLLESSSMLTREREVSLKMSILVRLRAYLLREISLIDRYLGSQLRAVFFQVTFCQMSSQPIEVSFSFPLKSSSSDLPDDCSASEPYDFIYYPSSGQQICPLLLKWSLLPYSLLPQSFISSMQSGLSIKAEESLPVSLTWASFATQNLYSFEVWHFLLRWITQSIVSLLAQVLLSPTEVDIRFDLLILASRSLTRLCRVLLLSFSCQSYSLSCYTLATAFSFLKGFVYSKSLSGFLDFVFSAIISLISSCQTFRLYYSS